MSKTPQNGEPKKDGAAPRGTLRLADPYAIEHWPNLVECLQERWDGNKLTLKGFVLRIRAVTSLYAIDVLQPTQRLKATILCDNLVSVFDEIERHLAQGIMPWEADFAEGKEAGQRWRK